MRAILKPLRKSFIANCMILVAQNQLSRLLLLTGNIATDSGTAHADRHLAESIGYIDMVFREYKEQAGIERFSGKVAEVGPGDNCGVGLLLLADGCVSVDLVDRFYSRRDETQQSTIYRALISRSPDLMARFGAIDKEDGFTGISRRYGADASAERFFRTNKDYDFIISRAVMEHVNDPAEALKHMSAALKPGGRMMHAVDLRDHGMFSGQGFAHTKFLEVSDSIYRYMTDATGRPNRVPLSAYRRALEAAGLEYEIKVTSLIGEDMLEHPAAYADIDHEVRERALRRIRSRRERLARSLRHETDEDLSISGIFIVARRPYLIGPKHHIADSRDTHPAGLTSTGLA